ncbi:hypothetical protein RJ640_009985 [Escallonia rubra]|uniref:Myb-like domain-containing protein n=1 Tax=Escallonia rubra TaxID=112253 RepID=A0AA88UFM8_9ASTE|nr:hypothetical protein RJ640_009985 [Escallonia rubra]
MLETSVFLENPAAAGGTGAVNLRNEEAGGGGSSGGLAPGGLGEEGDRNSAGNRWPREETLALLKVRSEMDVAFRDSTIKAPLWDDVSRKLGELGYHRSAKKCKEKFENIYKYHRRTKEGRSGRQDGKNYQFFEQLEVFDSQQPSLASPPPSNKLQNPMTVPPMAAIPTVAPITAVMINPTTVSQGIVGTPCVMENRSSEFMSTSTSATSSSGKESEGNSKKKRQLADYFERLMKEVLEKQENLQNKFIEAIENCEKDRIAREEAWKLQEMARVKREQDILAQERAVSAAKDAAVIAFLQKISQQPIPVESPEKPTPPPQESVEKQDILSYGDNSNSNSNSGQGCSSRWPKQEVEALIQIKSNMESQYADNGPKGPLWEAISSSMKKLGYDRSAKRCKEKWENINKYFKRVKESNKRRPEYSKTCPYFHQLEALYERKNKKALYDRSESSGNLKPEDILMQLMTEQGKERPLVMTDGGKSEDIDQNQALDVDCEDDEDNGDDYQVVTNNPSSVATME